MQPTFAGIAALARGAATRVDSDPRMMEVSTSTLLASSLLVFAGCTLIVDSAPKKDASMDTDTEPDVADVFEVVDTGPDLPDVDEEFEPGCLAVALSAGGSGADSHSCAVFDGGAVYCWGSNAGGALGTASGIDMSEVPVGVVGLESGASFVTAGTTLTCALDATDRVLCWGTPMTGTAAQVTLTSTPIDIAAGDGFACAALDTGDVECWGEPPVAEIAGVHAMDAAAEQVCAGAGHVCALLSGGALQCWGENMFGQVGNGESGTTRTSPDDVTGLDSGVVHVACGESHTCAAIAGGGVRCWGANFAGQLGDGTIVGKPDPVEVMGLSGMTVVGVSAGSSHTCVVTAGGAVWCFGENDHGQLGNGDIGDSSAVPQQVDALLSGADIVAAGADHVCALLDTGAIMCWGRNSSGQLGDGTTSTWPVPVWVLADCS
jgi:alpha-tubulin suppressor-like RCC1 family protein